MSDLMEVEVKGLVELDRSLRNLKAEIQRDIGQKALNAGCRIVKLAAVAKAPYGKYEYSYPYKTRVRNRRRVGQLKESVRFGKGKPRSGAAIRAIAYLIKKRGFYGIFIERGWVPTGPRKTGYLSRHKITYTQHRAYARAKREKIQGRPFMEPALVQNVNQVLDRIVEKMRQLIDRETWRVK